MANTKGENVTVKVPENLMRLLEEKNYFGKTKEAWFANAVNEGVDKGLNELGRKLGDWKEVRRLEKKYGLDYLSPSFKPQCAGGC